MSPSYMTTTERPSRPPYALLLHWRRTLKPLGSRPTRLSSTAVSTQKTSTSKTFKHYSASAKPVPRFKFQTLLISSYLRVSTRKPRSVVRRILSKRLSAHSSRSSSIGSRPSVRRLSAAYRTELPVSWNLDRNLVSRLRSSAD